MRQQAKQISRESVEEVLGRERYGVLATTGEDGYAYASPSVFFYENNKIYFHCAYKGHKQDNFSYNNRISFCVVEAVTCKQNPLNSDYRSVIAFGNVRTVEDESERMQAFIGLCKKYGMMEKVEDPNYIQKRNKATKVICIDIEHITGRKP